jgi:hypothetical protein
VGNICCKCRGFKEGAFCNTPCGSFRRQPVASGLYHFVVATLPSAPEDKWLHLVYTSFVDDPQLGRGTESLHGLSWSGWVGPRGGLEALEKINSC